jgi:hypothetical protein
VKHNHVLSTDFKNRDTCQGRSFLSYIKKFVTEQLIMIMSMEREYVSELRPPMGLLFIPYVIYEHGEPWWIDINREILLIRPPELSDKSTSRAI